MQYRYKLSSFLLLFLTLTYFSYGQFTDKKRIEKDALINKDARVSINSKHGAVQITSWAKDSIRIRVNIEGSSKNLSKLEEMMTRTHIITRLNADYADISTHIDENFLSQEWKNIKNIAGYSGEEIKVNYKIWLPSTCKLNIQHEFGNVYLNDYLGELSLDMDHGDLRAGKITKLGFASLSFVNAYIKELGDSRIDLSFGELDLGKAGDLKIESKASTLEINEIKKLQMISTRDKVEIDNLGEANINSSLSKFEINGLTKQIDISLKYGKLRLENINASCNTITIRPSRSTVDLSFEPGCNFEVDGIGEELDLIITPGLGSINGNSFHIEGKVGAGSSTKKLYINGDHSTISLNKS
ncbi:hypothetical protein GYB22_00335 [bacterium]|nr:hypothetical protein [bacterium]